MLTASQEEFVKGLIEGKTNAEAYRKAYPKQAEKCKEKTIWEYASRLANNPKVKERLKELRAELAIPSIMTAQERLEYLTRVIKGEEPERYVTFVQGERIEEDVPPSIKTRLNAVDIMNKMQGEYVQRVEAEVTKEVIINIELCDDE